MARPTRSPGSATSRSRSAASPGTTSPTRSPRPAPHAPSARRSRRSAHGLRRLPAVDRPLARPAQHLPAGGAPGHRRLRPQRGRHLGPARRRRGDRRRAAGRAAPITAIIGTAGDRPDDTLRGIGRIAAAAGPAGRGQGDLQVPARPDPRVGGRRAAGRRQGGRRDDRGRARLPVRDRALRAELNGRAARSAPARAPGRTRRGSSCSCARRIARESSGC